MAPGKTIGSFSLISLLLLSTVAFAAKPPVYSHKRSGAIKGVDVVAYFDLQPGAKAVKGSDDFTYQWQGATWKFSSAENRRRFIDNPQAYVPQYGGYCAFAVAHNFVTSPRPDSWKIVDGKLYLNNNRTSFRRWQEDQAAKIIRADENWPAVLDK